MRGRAGRQLEQSRAGSKKLSTQSVGRRRVAKADDDKPKQTRKLKRSGGLADGRDHHALCKNVQGDQRRAWKAKRLRRRAKKRSRTATVE